MSENNNRQPNRLIAEASPYLRQHAYNPVDWYPWGDEALERARREDKPIFLSIGYSACHWCHVMEHESFEDPEIAAVMNRDFVNIKVDREERPDLDMIYQKTAQLTGVQGGWPLSVFLAPDQRPFWLATYIPPDDRYGRTGFPTVLEAIHKVYRERRDEVGKVGRRMVEALGSLDAPPAESAAPAGAGGPGTEDMVPGGPLDDLADLARAADGDELLAGAAAALTPHFDQQAGGFGSRPKFPNVTALELFLRHGVRNDSPTHRNQVLFALKQMAGRGLYDHLGGGFHRYCVDSDWTVPHFEKMLYDNALLPPLYLAAYQWTGEDHFAQVVRETLDYVLREMTDPAGGFYSTQDADSEGEEGKFFVWTPQEFRQVLGADDAEVLAAYFGVTAEGNFEDHRTVLTVAADPDDLGRRFKLTPEQVRRRIEKGRQSLFEARRRRFAPATDDKVLTAWNGMMISALSQAALVLDDDRYAGAACRAADFLLARMWQADGELKRVYRETVRDVPGYLDDYAFLMLGLIDLYQATFQTEYLEAAQSLAGEVLDRFWDEAAGGFYFTPVGASGLVYRPRDLSDSSTPSATGAVALALIRLTPFSVDDRLRRTAARVFEVHGRLMHSNPFGAASLILAYSEFAGGPVEITMVRKNPMIGEADLAAWRRSVAARYVPGRLLTLLPADFAAGVGGARTANGARPPVWEGKTAAGEGITAYVCQNFTCSQPITGRDELDRHLAAASSRGSD
ncbi:MAG: thioredoxin domain-containing protein [Thermaerobacterales bacterium]